MEREPFIENYFKEVLEQVLCHNFNIPLLGGGTKLSGIKWNYEIGSGEYVNAAIQRQCRARTLPNYRQTLCVTNFGRHGCEAWVKSKYGRVGVSY